MNIITTSSKLIEIMMHEKAMSLLWRKYQWNFPIV